MATGSSPAHPGATRDGCQAATGRGGVAVPCRAPGSGAPSRARLIAAFTSRPSTRPGVLLTQASFRAGRLDWALPPTAAAQPIAGIVIGVVLLGDHLAATGLALAFESLSLVAMLGGVLPIGQSRAFGS